MKYVIGQQELSGYYLPIVFTEEIVHAVVAKVLTKHQARVLSAGFVSRRDGRWCVDDRKSESLNLGPAPDDVVILNLFLEQGLSGLELQNMLTMIELMTRGTASKHEQETNAEDVG